MTADTIPIQDTDYDLQGLETLAWESLSRGAQSGRDFFHTGVMCSTSRDGTPDGRTMVLRQVDAGQRLLASYTDLRAPKVQTLAASPSVGWVFYDPRRRLEIRASGRMRVFSGTGDSVAEAQWANLPLSAQQAYASDRAVGLRQDLRSPSGVDAAAAGTASPPSRNYDNFAVLLTFVERLEILYLHHGGHHRARFLYKGEKLVERHWVST